MVGATFLSDPTIYQGKHTDRQNWKRSPRGLRPGRSNLGLYESCIELATTRWHAPVDESRANRPGTVWAGG